MTDSSIQDGSNIIEALPMTILETKASPNLPKSETGTGKHERPDNEQQLYHDRKVFWADVRPKNRSLLVGSITDENACPTCGSESPNRPLYQIGRMSLPLNGKYANNFRKENFSEANGVCAYHTIPHKPDTRNGGKSHLSMSQSGNKYFCGSSVNQGFQNRDPEMPWKSKGNYFVAVLTYLLGVGNVVRFPQLCFKHGGGAFFIPYFVMLIIEGIPLVCLEMAVGQRLRRNSVVESWKDLSPSLRGIGMAATLMSLITIFYYNYIVAWCLYYFVHSMRSNLPWRECPTIKNNGTHTLVPECSKSSPAEYYWYRETLNVADDINNSPGINMYLYLFVVVSWTLSCLLAMRGSRKASKILVVALIFIVTNLVVFFFLGVHLDGWAEGLARLFIPKMEKLKDPVVWMDAAGQIFYSLGVGFGTLTLFSTGNKPKNSCYTDALLCALGNCGTSVWASIIMFSLFGFKADYKARQCEIDRNASLEFNGSKPVSCNKEEILDQLPPGLSLGFAGLSEAFTRMPGPPPLWSTLFYFLLFLLGSSSMLGMIEIVLTTCKEMKIFKRTWRDEVICAIFCLALCVSNLLFVQSTGFYLLEIISSASAIPLLLTGLAECVGVSFVYGMDRFSKDITLMTGKRVKSRWQICWKFISPLIILGVIIGGIIQMIKQMADGKFTYTAWDRTKAKVMYHQYPAWGYVIYMVFVVVPLLCIIYPPIIDCITNSRLDTEQTEARSRAIDCEACSPGCMSRSRTYNLSPFSSPRVNGHVNQVVEHD